jgi:hypothetical protein
VKRSGSRRFRWTGVVMVFQRVRYEERRQVGGERIKE